MGLREVTKSTRPEHHLDDGRSGFVGSKRPRPARPSALGLGLLLNIVRDVPMLPVIVVVLIVLSFTIDGFMSVGNLQNIMRQLSVILIAVTGQTLVLLIGGIDLSMGATIGLASVCGAFTMHYMDSSLLGLLACLATGIAIGALNGFGIARIGLQPFIMTFGMMLTVRAAAFLLTAGLSVGRLPKVLLQTGRMNFAGLPLVFILGLAVALSVGFVLSRTVFGEKIYLTGSNPRAAAFSGIDVQRLKFQVYLIAGAAAGAAAFVFMMRLGAATPTAGDQLLLQIIGSVVLGGTSLNGGEGGIIRSCSGAVLVAIIIKSLEILGAQFWDQMIVIGALVALGSALGAWLSRLRTRESKRADATELLDHLPDATSARD
jgi:ribose/xylose/arabinose/galactoside ABC-type transport system permease subunit